MLDLAAAEDEKGFAAALTAVIRSLLDRHGTGRVLFRNTRSSVSGFPERKLHEYPLPAPESYQQASTVASIEQLLAPEVLLGDTLARAGPTCAMAGRMVVAESR